MAADRTSRQRPLGGRLAGDRRRARNCTCVEVPDFEPSAFEAEFGRHIAVSYPLDGFDDLKARLRSHGAELIEPKRPTSFERFFFRDPSGYVFEVVEKQEGP